VDSRAGLDDVGKRKFLTLPGLELQHLDLIARSQSQYRLRYPGSSAHWVPGTISPQVKRQGHELQHSPSRAQVMNDGAPGTSSCDT
jgi:hypothetical protein